MKAVCPNAPTHSRFITVAYVSEDWVVDREGNFLEVYLRQVQETLHRPDPDNIWSCAECGAEAKVER